MIGLVATRMSVSEGQNDTAARVYGCFATFARDNITSLRVVWSHWWGNAQSPAGNLTIMGAEIEYPAGVYTPITFSGGSASVVTGPLTNVTSDPVSVTIPNGALFHVRGLYDGCCNQTRGPNALIGEGNVYPATGLTLVTARSASFNANFTFTPSAIIGETGKPCAFILGDSHPSGLGDSYQHADGSYGTVGGALNAYGWAQMVQWGGSPADYLAAAGPLQAELVGYASDVVAEFCGNHLFDSDTAAATLAIQASIRALYPAKRFHLTTCTPKTSSSDNWSSATQGLIANEAQVQAYNVAVIANGMGYAAPIDMASMMEDVRGNGKWKYDGTANKFTIDGVHPSPYLYGLFSSAGFTLVSISAQQYSSMRAMLRGALAANSSLVANPSDGEVLSFFNQILTEASGTPALPAAQQSAIGFAFRGLLSGNFAGVSNPSDADVLAFWTQLSADSSGASTLAMPRYQRLKDTLREVVSLNYPGASNPTLRDLLGYLLTAR